jgi:hypothetical protein
MHTSTSAEQQRSRRSTSSRTHAAAAAAVARMQERKKLLSFVIVGGGPTGVEVAAEMYDMITEDMRKLYPELLPDVKIRVIELMDYVLSAYDRTLGEYTAQLFQRNGIDLVRPPLSHSSSATARQPGASAPPAHACCAALSQASPPPHRNAPQQAWPL